MYTETEEDSKQRRVNMERSKAGTKYIARAYCPMESILPEVVDGLPNKPKPTPRIHPLPSGSPGAAAGKSIILYIYLIYNKL